MKVKVPEVSGLLAPSGVLAPASPSSWLATGLASTVHCASALDQDARFTRSPNRIWRSMPASAAVSRTYCRIEGPSAMALAPVHGRQR